MRALVIAFVLASAPAAAETIEQVLQRSQIKRLESTTPLADTDTRAQTIRATFQRLLDAGHRPSGGVELRVVEGVMLAECLLGRVIMVDASMSQLPVGERLFVLAHELGHLINGHWAHVGNAFRKHIPGDVEPSQADAAHALIGPEMSAMSHRHELDADAYGFRAIQRMGYGLDTVLASFMRYGVQQDTATHPSTRKRVAHLRVLAEQP